MESGRVLFLGVAFATHAAVGVALVRGFTHLEPRAGLWMGIAFGLAPDVDFLFPASMGWPFVHRGLTHSPLFALTLVAGVYAVRRTRPAALAAGLAVGSHLLVDSLSPSGILWLFPLEATWSPGLDVHGAVATTLLWTFSLGVLALRTDDLDGISGRISGGIGDRLSRDGSRRQRSD